MRTALTARLRAWLLPLTVEQRALRLSYVLAGAFALGLAACVGMLYFGLRGHLAFWPCLALATAMQTGLLMCSSYVRPWLRAFGPPPTWGCSSCTSDLTGLTLPPDYFKGRTIRPS